jgi:flagellar biosynthetic protein FliR
MMAFFAAGGPVWLFAALAQSFQAESFQPGIIPGAPSWHALLVLGGIVFSGAVALAVPVLAVALSVNITVGLLSIFAPQLNVLSIGFPMLILAGLWMLAASCLYAGPDYLALMRAGLNATAQVLGG